MVAMDDTRGLTEEDLLLDLEIGNVATERRKCTPLHAAKNAVKSPPKLHTEMRKYKNKTTFPRRPFILYLASRGT